MGRRAFQFYDLNFSMPGAYMCKIVGEKACRNNVGKIDNFAHKFQHETVSTQKEQ